MGAFQAIRDAEAVKNDQHFFESKPGVIHTQDYATPIDSIRESYRKGEYSGGEDRPTHNWRGRKIIKGFTASQRIKGDQDRQDERDEFFYKASRIRHDNTKDKTKDKSAETQSAKSYYRQMGRYIKRGERLEEDEKALNPKTGDS